MSEKGEVTSALTSFVKRKAKGNDSLLCTVKSYDAGTMTCYCEPIGDFADIQQVKICPDTDGHITFPKVDSEVLVSFMSDSSAYVAMVSAVDAVWLAGDQYGGLIKINDLVTKLNALENRVNTLIATLSGWTVVANDGGAALKAAVVELVTTTLSAITPTVKADIENAIVKHGNGTT